MGRGVLLGVFVAEGVGVMVNVSVGGISVGVGVLMICGAAATVNAAAVFKLATARSSRLCGSILTELEAFVSDSAIAETTQSRLKPRAPAASTPNGPE